MVGTLIVAAAAGTTAAGVAASFALTAAAFAVNFAVSMIVTRMFGDNPEKQQDMGVRQQVPPSSVNAIPVVYGDAYMGGTFVDAVLTTDQKTMYYVLAISSISSANSTLGTSAGVFNYDMSEMYYGDRLISFSSSGSVQSGRIFNGGTGYVVGDVLTISGGTFTTAAVFTVTQVSTGGVITAASLTTPGSYTSAPNNPALVTGGTGTGASGVLKFSTYTNTVTALTDEAGNVDTKINGNLYINLYKSSSAGVITSVNGASAPSVVMGGSDIASAQQWTGTRQMNNLAFAIVRHAANAAPHSRFPRAVRAARRRGCLHRHRSCLPAVRERRGAADNGTATRRSDVHRRAWPPPPRHRGGRRTRAAPSGHRADRPCPCAPSARPRRRRVRSPVRFRANPLPTSSGQSSMRHYSEASSA